MGNMGLNQGHNIMPFTDKDIKCHFSGIKIVEEGGRYVGFNAGDEHFGPDVDFSKFLLCGCYVGFATAYIEKRNEVLIPVRLIKNLLAIRETLEIGDKPLIPHMIMLKKAFALIGYDAGVSIKQGYFLDIEIVGKMSEGVEGKDDRQNCIRFRKNGADDDIFLGRMLLSLVWFF
jgi:hypothetical protein